MIVVKDKDPRFVISPDEMLYRVVDYPSGVAVNDKAKVDPRAFRLFRRNEYYISLTRARYASDKDVAEAGAYIKKHLMPEDHFYGYVTLPAEIFFTLRNTYRLTLDSYYEPNNEGHAGFTYWTGPNTMQKTLPEGESAPEEYVAICTILCDAASKIVRCE
mgnify:CR=1 FL=1